MTVHLADLPTLPAWFDEALCTTVDPEIFFPDHGPATRAKAVCAECPVAARCLAYALRHQTAGVWAGTTEHDRRRFQRLRRPHPCSTCDRTFDTANGRDMHEARYCKGAS